VKLEIFVVRQSFRRRGGRCGRHALCERPAQND